jgi:hypothetical protein
LLLATVYPPLLFPLFTAASQRRYCASGAPRINKFIKK